MSKNVLVTGGAGFIGSNLITRLLKEDYRVTCLDNLATGSEENIAEFQNHSDFTFVKGDILDVELMRELTQDVDIVSHQAALGSVPRSINDPLLSNRVNVEGTLNVFKASADNGVDKVIYAASSSTYGDSPILPKKEAVIGRPLSPYAVTKYAIELYADVFYKTYGLNTIGLRYFNVFGPKQNPKGPYAAVIPLFIKAILEGTSIKINGDGNHSRDFTFVENAVEANIRAMEAPFEEYNSVYNIAYGESTNLNQLVDYLKEFSGSNVETVYGDERPGDIAHSLADIRKAKTQLNYNPKFSLKEGLKITFDWYKQNNYNLIKK